MLYIYRLIQKTIYFSAILRFSGMKIDNYTTYSQMNQFLTARFLPNSFLTLTEVSKKEI